MGGLQAGAIAAPLVLSLQSQPSPAPVACWSGCWVGRCLCQRPVLLAQGTRVLLVGSCSRRVLACAMCPARLTLLLCWPSCRMKEALTWSRQATAAVVVAVALTVAATVSRDLMALQQPQVAVVVEWMLQTAAQGMPGAAAAHLSAPFVSQQQQQHQVLMGASQ